MFVCVCTSSMCGWKVGFRPPEAGITQLWVTRHGWWKPNSGLLQQQQALNWAISAVLPMHSSWMNKWFRQCNNENRHHLHQNIQFNTDKLLQPSKNYLVKSDCCVSPINSALFTKAHKRKERTHFPKLSSQNCAICEARCTCMFVHSHTYTNNIKKLFTSRKTA